MLRIRNRSRLEGYVCELIGKPKVELEKRDKKFLIELLDSPKSVYGMTKIVNRKFEFKPPIADDDNNKNSNISQDSLDPNAVFVFSSGPLSSPAVLKRIRKLVRHELIENVDKKSLTDKARLAANLHRAKLFRVIEYGLFCMLSGLLEYEPTSLFWRYWKTKVMRMLLSSYFEKKTVLRLTTRMYFTIAQFLMEACTITIRRLRLIEDARRENDDAEYQEQIMRLEDDLLWHAKSFALRLLVDSASRNKDRRLSSRAILAELARDKKFRKLTDTAVREILSYYRGGRSLKLDKARLS